jgi:hypothetical protein
VVQKHGVVVNKLAKMPMNDTSANEMFTRRIVWSNDRCKDVVSSASFNTASIVLFLPRLGSGGGFRIGVDAGTTGLATGLGSGR